MVRGRNGPGWVRATRSRISGTSAGPSRTTSGSGCLGQADVDQLHPDADPGGGPAGGGTTWLPEMAKVPPGPTSSAASCQAAGSEGSASATNGAMSGRYRGRPADALARTAGAVRSATPTAALSRIGSPEPRVRLQPRSGRRRS